VTGEEIFKTIEKQVEIEIDDKALLIPARVDSVPYSIYVLN
jgi:hypothetical protein